VIHACSANVVFYLFDAHDCSLHSACFDIGCIKDW
jgi:hypothetical protein